MLRRFVTVLLALAALCTCAPHRIEARSTWEDRSPIVLYDSRMPPEYSESLCKAVDEWRKRGYKFRGCFRALVSPLNTDAFGPDGMPLPGLIVVVMAKELPPGTVAVTMMGTDESGHMQSALMVVQPGYYSERLRALVFGHELGHALGFEHVWIRGNIMYPALDGAGFNDDGLRR